VFILDIIDRIIDLMNRNSVTAAQLTRDIGLTNGLITQWKQRKQNPSMEKLNMIASYFNVSVDYLLGNEQKKSSAEAEEINDPKIREILTRYQKLPANLQRQVEEYVQNLHNLHNLSKKQ
jgi:transcriptional regulator with XRE-family HTH domain